MENKIKIKNENFKTALIVLSTLFIFSIIFSMMLPSLASASVTAVSTTASASRVTTGTSVTISASITASGSETSSANFVSTPSGITVSDPPGGSYSSVTVSTSPVTKTFTISAGSSGTYTYYVQAGSMQSNAATIVYVDPSALTVSGSPSSTSNTSGSTFTLSISIQNAQTSATTTSYSLTLPSGYSASGDATSATISVGASSTTTLQWTITVGSASGTVSFQLGSNTNAFSSSVTCTDCESSSSSSSSSSGGGGAASTSSNVTGGMMTKIYASIIPESTKTITSLDLSSTASQFTEITFAVLARATDVSFMLQGFGSAAKPTDAPASDPASASVYRYVKITTVNLDNSNIASAKIKFKVEKAWLTTNNVPAASVALYRFNNNVWSLLSTTKTSEDANNYYYEAIVPGFSYFIIGGMSSTTPTTTRTTTSAATTGTSTTTSAPSGLKLPTTLIVGIVLIFVVIIVLLFVVQHMKKPKEKE